MGEIRTIRVEAMTRVEGEGSLRIRLSDGKIDTVQLSIFEPPRLFEAFLRGRALEEVPDITARICGICPVAYQMSSVHALESALGVQVSEELRRLRRLLYCGEWIESHALHVHMLHAPDFLGYDNALVMAKDFPEAVNRGLRLKKHGNQLLDVLGGRAVHPMNVAVGGFYRLPRRDELAGARAGLRVGIASGHRDDPLGGQLRLSPVRAALRFRGPVASRRVRHVRGHDSLKRRPGDRRIAIRRTLPRAAGSPFHRLAGRAPRHGPNVFPGALGAASISIANNCCPRLGVWQTRSAWNTLAATRSRASWPAASRSCRPTKKRWRFSRTIGRRSSCASSTTTRQPRARRPPKRPRTALSPLRNRRPRAGNQGHDRAPHVAESRPNRGRSAPLPAGRRRLRRRRSRTGLRALRAVVRSLHQLFHPLPQCHLRCRP